MKKSPYEAGDFRAASLCLRSPGVCTSAASHAKALSSADILICFCSRRYLSRLFSPLPLFLHQAVPSSSPPLLLQFAKFGQAVHYFRFTACPPRGGMEISLWVAVAIGGQTSPTA